MHEPHPRCLYCGGPNAAWLTAKYCCDWCRSQQRSANEAPPLPGGHFDDLPDNERRAVWGVVGFRASKGVPLDVAVAWAAGRFGVDDMRLWVLLDRFGGWASTRIAI